MNDTVPSPCISVCALDEDDICLGCFRSGDEITDWFMADDERKREILTLCERRRGEKQPVQLG
jgi:predicted Fe-S protein YdhL (DUF1289 family)